MELSSSLSICRQSLAVSDVTAALDLARRTGDKGAVFLPGVARQNGAHWLVGPSLTPTAGSAWSDGATHPSALWLMAYVESTASTPASVDGPVGFLSDGEGTLGAAIAITNGALTANATGWTQVNSPGLSFGPQGVTITKAGASDAQLLQAITTVIGNWYLVTGFISGATNNYIFGADAGNTGYQAVNGWVRAVFKATATTSYITLQQGGSTGASSTFGQVSVWNLTGRHATQNSGPNKPVMRRGLVNQMRSSSNLTASPWQQFNSAGSLIATNGTAGAGYSTINLVANGERIQQPVPSTAGQTKTMFVLLSGTGSVYLNMVDEGGSYPGTFSGMITLTATPTMYSLSRTHTDAAANYMSGRVTAANGAAATVTVSASAMFDGNVTAAQVAAAGGIATTTTVAASSSGGGHWLQSNGSSTAMSLPAPLISLTDDCVVVAGMRMDVASGGGYFCGAAAAANTSTAARAGVLAVGPSNMAQAYWTNDAATFFVCNAGTITPGVPFVMSAVQRSGVAKARLNGGAWSNTVAPTGAATLNAAGLCSAYGFQTFNGAVWAWVAFKGTFTDAEVLVLERGVAALCPIPNLLRF